MWRHELNEGKREWRSDFHGPEAIAGEIAHQPPATNPPRRSGVDSSLAKYAGHLRLVFLATGKLEILEARAECFE